MTDRDFDMMMRASAEREDFTVTEHTENRLRKAISEGMSAKRVRRFTARTAILAAVIVLLLAATALAVSNLPGVVELMNKMGMGVSDERMEHIMQQTPQPQNLTYELKDIRVTLGEIIYDGNMLYASAQVSPKEDSSVVLVPMDSSPRWYYGVPESENAPEDAKTIAETAEERGARLVSVSLFVEAPSTDGSVGISINANPDGSFDYIFELPSVLTDESGNIPIEISGLQFDITDEQTELSGTRDSKAWHISVPAPVEPLVTAAPEAEPAAAPEGALRVLGFENTNLTKAYKSVYPDGEIVYLGDDADPAQTDWDVCYAYTNMKQFDALKQSGIVLYDLSGSESLSAWAGGMYEPVKRFVYNGEALELIPIDIFGGTYRAMFTHSMRFNDIDAWKQAGFTDEEMPETLNELFDLIDKYTALPKSVRKGIRFNWESEYARSWLVGLVLDMYAADGNGGAFSTEEMTALLKRADKAADALKKDNAIGYAVYPECFGSLQGAANAVPLKFNAESPKRVYASMSVLGVNGSSPRANEAVRFIEAVVNDISWNMIALLDADVTYEELGVISLEQEIALTKEQAEYFQAQSENAPDTTTRKEDLAYSQELLDSIDTIKKYAENEDGILAGTRLIYPEDMAAYRANIAPYLCFDKFGAAALFEDSGEFSKLKDDYLAKKLSLDKFLWKLDQLTR